MSVDESSVRIDVSRSAITSAINRARYPQSLVLAIAADEVSHLLDFDYCHLVLPDSTGQGIRVWRAPRSPLSEQRVSTIDSFDQTESLLARVANDCSPKVIEPAEISEAAARDLGVNVKSALALPLSIGGKCFGIVCFASAKEDAYAENDSERLMWLADHVAAVAHSMLLRARLESMNENLLEMDRLKSGFVNTLVRDIRLPLTSVLGLLELFEGKLQTREPFDLEDRQLLSNALENGGRMRLLLDDHLEIARQHEQPLSLTIEETLVELMLEDVAEPLRGEAALRGVELNISVASREMKACLDASQTRRALSHLLTVALASTPDGSAIQIEAQTIMGARTGDEGKRFIIISISDSSPGIPPEDVPFVFDAFWQASDNRKAGGQGVGLAIAKRIAAAHGGNVSVRSQRGHGTIYSLILPSGETVSSIEAQRILIVDDAPDLLLLLKKLVERMGYQVEIASSAVEALAILREKKIDLLLTDWSMPEMSGGELIAVLKQDEQWRGIPTIVLTGHDTDNERREAERVGCDRFLVKPIMRDELQRIIYSMLPVAAAN